MKKEYENRLLVKHNESLHKFVQSHPNLAYSECSLSTKINHATVTDTVKGNKDIHHAQHQNANNIIIDTDPIKM